MTFKPGTIKLAAANSIFQETGIAFESVEFAGKVAGWQTVAGSRYQCKHANLTDCVQSVITQLWRTAMEAEDAKSI